MTTANEKRYEGMKYNRCGKSGLMLSAVSLGLWQNFGSVDSFANARQMILHAFDLGITHFDIANNYGPVPGSAEKNFGKVLKNDLKKYRDEIIVSTKAGYRMWPGPYGEWGSRKNLLASLDQSLQRLGLDYVDIFYHHRPDKDTPVEESMGALEQALRQGKALYAAISNYNLEQSKKAVEVCKALGVRLLIHQPRYSMLERWIEDGLHDYLQQEGVGMIPFSVLAGGKLTERYFNGIPADSRAVRKSNWLSPDTITADYLKKAHALAEVAKSRGQSLAQMALSWALRKSNVTSVLVGASKPRQIDENIACLKNTEFPAGQLEQIEKILKA